MRPDEMDRVSVSAFGTGLAGALIYCRRHGFHRTRRSRCTDWTAYVIFIVMIGGIGTIEGPILGVLVFFILQSLLADYGSWYLMASASSASQSCCSRRAGFGA
jgi:branched-chain amino acid transport system permease protein